jgi:hypothetical protein
VPAVWNSVIKSGEAFTVTVVFAVVWPVMVKPFASLVTDVIVIEGRVTLTVPVMPDKQWTEQK